MPGYLIDGAVGIEHFSKSIKTIRYRAVVPKSCLKNLKPVDGSCHDRFTYCGSREGY